MRLAFVWYYDKASEIMPNWRDGLRAAIEIIAKDNKVDWFLDKKLPNPEDYDFILVWDDSNSRVPDLLGHATRMGLCLTTDAHNITNLSNFDVVFCESDIILEDVRKHGIRAIKAFGTDSNFFTPDDTKKDIEYFYPATFSPWKRQQDIASYGDKLTCVGTVQPDGQEQLDACTKAGVNLKIGYYPVEEIRDLYRRSKRVVIPAEHGSERTVLEAMSMNIPIDWCLHTNVKVKLLMDECAVSEINKETKTPRDFILKNYSSEKYAEALMKGISG